MIKKEIETKALVNIETLGAVQFCNLDADYHLAMNTSNESYIGLIARIDHLMCQIKRIILMSYLGHEVFLETNEKFKKEINEFITSHEKIYEDNKKSNTGKMN